MQNEPKDHINQKKLLKDHSLSIFADGSFRHFRKLGCDFLLGFRLITILIYFLTDVCSHESVILRLFGIKKAFIKMKAFKFML